MKQFISKILLSLTIISCINLNLYAENNIPAIREAIQNSRPNLLEKALDKTKLTEQDQKSLIDFAEQIAKQRETKMNLAFLTNKEKEDPKGALALGVLAAAITGSASLIKVIADILSNRTNPETAGYAFLVPASFATSYLLLHILKSNKYKNFRTFKQKWQNALQVKQILENRKIKN
ncbi:hypothetical protein [Candidatus Babela massiliensis]|uniref:Uncharacterized protein n=1 Tax=Candidatus Babela massiliensis TaxID=673862 RepID=V6DI38_9BACT|nr:hypothetical protein [Candidatus Babela massiliensis]CDK30598.1 hypothetical protein BABL1_gene_418 [Candidatus Babela massiliensis]